MTEAKATTAPFAKVQSRLLSLDEVPHKRHVPPPVLSAYNPLVPEPGTPAFAARKDQFTADTAAELKRTEEARRQHRKVAFNSICRLNFCNKICNWPVEHLVMSRRWLRTRNASVNLQPSTKVSVKRIGSSSAKGKES